MAEDTTLRLARHGDARGVAAIYAPVVQTTAISFETEPPTMEDMAQRIQKTLAHWPWMVCDRAGEVLGYAYASQHRERAAYQWSVDVSVYVHPRAHRSGIGRALYTSLIRLLVLQGFYNAYAGITLPNAASVGLHEAVGFRPVGVYRKVGFKLGAWHDVGWWSLLLQPPAARPSSPVDFPALTGDSEVEAAMKLGLPYLRGR